MSNHILEVHFVHFLQLEAKVAELARLKKELAKRKRRIQV